MARSIKRGFQGSYTVIEDGVQIGEVFKGTGAKERAEAFARNPLGTPDGELSKPKVSALEGERAHWAKVNADLAKPVTSVLRAMREVLEQAEDGLGKRLFEEHLVRAMLSAIEPIIKSGGQGFRRARRIHVMPAQVQA